MKRINTEDIKSLPTEDNEERNIKKKEEIKKELPEVGIFKLLFSISDRTNNLLFFIGFLGSLGTGLAWPINSFLLGKAVNTFSISTNPANNVPEINTLVIRYLYSAAGAFVACFFMISCFSLNGKRLVMMIKNRYFSCIISQDQEYFDTSNAYEYSSKILAQIQAIEQGVGDKVGNLVMLLSTFASNVVIAYTTSWKMSLVLSGVIPVIIIGCYFFSKNIQISSRKQQQIYQKAGGFAEEILYQYKVVTAFANNDHEIKLFDKYLKDTMKAGISTSLRLGMSLGFSMFITYFAFSMAIWYGGNLVSTKEVNSTTGELFKAGDIIIVIYGIVYGAFCLSESLPFFKQILDACHNSREFFDLMNRKPKSQVEGSNLKPKKNKIVGEIEFQDVCFSYSSDPSKMIIKNLSFKLEAGKKTALVGPSGSGKSTILNLLLRLYEPTSGKILIDGIDIRDIDIKYLRSLYGYVAQEPVLFNMSILDNVTFGRDYITIGQVKEACAKAHAKEFIEKFSDGYNFSVGNKGNNISVGQKQRISIARAIANDPKFLILDEATSALDNKSEKIVQQALDEISQNTTTVLIAHRLDTVQNSDKIIVIEKGSIIEEGSHKELLSNRMFYYNMIQSEKQKSPVKKKKIERKTTHLLGIDEDEAAVSSSSDEDDEDNIGGNERDRNFLQKEMIRRHNSKKMSIVTQKCLNKEEMNFIRDRGVRPTKRKTTKKLTVRLGNMQSMASVDEKMVRDIEEELRNLKIEEDRKREEYFDSCKSEIIRGLKNYKFLVFVASLSSSIRGLVWPVQGILLAYSMSALTLTTNLGKAYDDAFFLAMMFLLMAGVGGIAVLFQNYLFGVLGEKITRKIRLKIFSKYLSLQYSFFEQVENNPAKLINKLTQDTIKINGVILNLAGITVQVLVVFLFGVIMGFYYDWKMSLINLVFFPLMILNARMNFKIQQGFSQSDNKFELQAASILSESIINSKIIFCYNMQNKVVDLYNKLQNEKDEIVFKASTYSGIFFGFSIFFRFLTYGVLFYAGGQFSLHFNLSFRNMFSAIFSMLFTAFAIGEAQRYVKDYSESKESMINIGKLLEEVPSIDLNEKYDIQIIPKREKFLGKIEFLNVSFAYPSHPNQKILNNVSFVIEAGRSAAFVGPSGSGKSTIIQLILRFYDPDEGAILIDGINIKHYNLKEYRELLGIVSQEPILFKRSLIDNVKYGRLDANFDEVLEACKKAYIDYRITENEEKELILSGGEKQRISIARAIIRDPRILLLDEATSNLDNNSEAVVTMAINNLMFGRTSVSIAHRLNTIKASNIIFFLENGNIIESGNHENLMELKGKYFALYASSLGSPKKKFRR